MPAAKKTAKPAPKNVGGRPIGDPETSLVTRLCLLEVGESEAKAQHVEFEDSRPDHLSAIKEALGSSLRKAASRATSRSENTFSKVTTLDHRTSEGDVICVAVVTRVA